MSHKTPSCCERSEQQRMLKRFSKYVFQSVAGMIFINIIDGVNKKFWLAPGQFCWSRRDFMPWCFWSASVWRYFFICPKTAPECRRWLQLSWWRMRQEWMENMQYKNRLQEGYQFFQSISERMSVSFFYVISPQSLPDLGSTSGS